MKTTSIPFNSFVEHDNSPVLFFNTQGKIIYLNDAAEILMGYVTPNELYDMLLAYAPKDYGYKTTTIPLQYHTLHFYAITIGYEDDDYISIRLYHQPQLNQNKSLSATHYVDTDINTLLEANITLFKMYNQNSFTLFVDQEIPSFKIDQNHFSKLLRKTLESFKNSTDIEMRLTFIIGEYILIEEEKKSLIQLHIKANQRITQTDKDIQALATQSHITCTFQPTELHLRIPFIR